MKMPPYDPYRLLYRHNVGSAALMRRELFEDVGGYDPAFTGYEDWSFGCTRSRMAGGAGAWKR